MEEARPSAACRTAATAAAAGPPLPRPTAQRGSILPPRHAAANRDACHPAPFNFRATEGGVTQGKVRDVI